MREADLRYLQYRSAVRNILTRYVTHYCRINAENRSVRTAMDFISVYKGIYRKELCSIATYIGNDFSSDYDFQHRLANDNLVMIDALSIEVLKHTNGIGSSFKSSAITCQTQIA